MGPAFLREGHTFGPLKALHECVRVKAHCAVRIACKQGLEWHGIVLCSKPENGFTIHFLLNLNEFSWGDIVRDETGDYYLGDVYMGEWVLK